MQLYAPVCLQVKKALWLVRHQQLGYMIALQKQLLEVQMGQWARVEVLQVRSRAGRGGGEGRAAGDPGCGLWGRAMASSAPHAND